MKRQTGPTQETRALCWHRDGSCVRCGLLHHRLQLHHRRPRGAGGSRLADTNEPQNLVWLCEPCHAWIESYRGAARTYGYLVRQGHDPAAVPIRHHGRLVLLTPDGTTEDA